MEEDSATTSNLATAFPSPSKLLARAKTTQVESSGEVAAAASVIPDSLCSSTGGGTGGKSDGSLLECPFRQQRKSSKITKLPAVQAGRTGGTLSKAC